LGPGGVECPLEEFHTISSEFKPRVVGQVQVIGGCVVVGDGASASVLEADGRDPVELAGLLRRLNGTRTVSAIAAEERELDRGDLEAFLDQLDASGLLDDAAVPSVRSGLSAVLELEDLVDELCSRTLFRNVFWEKCLSAQGPGDMPSSVITGLVIENYHFLFRESYFDSPVLSYVPNTAVRLAINRFFSEEYGHDEILLRALQSAGFSRSDLADTMPLPATLALCNSLAYWSRNDPLFFFSSLGLLEGQGLKHDSFIQACERMQVDEAFVEPLRVHSNINIQGGHGNLTRELFSHIPAIDSTTMTRLRAQTHLFVELYDQFYTNVWEFYSTSPVLLRRVSRL
jgi:hypothetical protein